MKYTHKGRAGIFVDTWSLLAEKCRVEVLVSTEHFCCTVGNYNLSQITSLLSSALIHTKVYSSLKMHPVRLCWSIQNQLLHSVVQGMLSLRNSTQFRLGRASAFHTVKSIDVCGFISQYPRKRMPEKLLQSLSSKNQITDWNYGPNFWNEIPVTLAFPMFTQNPDNSG